MAGPRVYHGLAAQTSMGDEFADCFAMNDVDWIIAAGSITGPAASFTANKYDGQYVVILTGTAQGKFYYVTDNTATVLNINPANLLVDGVADEDRICLCTYGYLPAVYTTAFGVILPTLTLPEPDMDPQEFWDISNGRQRFATAKGLNKLQGTIEGPMQNPRLIAYGLGSEVSWGTPKAGGGDTTMKYAVKAGDKYIQCESLVNFTVADPVQVGPDATSEIRTVAALFANVLLTGNVPALATVIPCNPATFKVGDYVHIWDAGTPAGEWHRITLIGVADVTIDGGGLTNPYTTAASATISTGMMTYTTPFRADHAAGVDVHEMDTTAHYHHSWTPIQCGMPSFSWEAVLKNVTDFVRYYKGCRVDEFELTCEPGKPLTINATIKAKKFAKGTTASTISMLSTAPYQWHQGSISFGGTTIARVTKLSCKFGNGMEDLGAIQNTPSGDGVFVKEHVYKKAKSTWNMTVAPFDTTLWDQLVADTTYTAIATFTRTASSDLLTVTVTGIRIKTAPHNAPEEGPVYVELTGDGSTITIEAADATPFYL